MSNIIQYSNEQIQLIKNNVAKGASDDELKLFLHIAGKTGLDPFTRQIYCVPRWDSKLGRNVYSAQTSVDGFRLVALRSGQYAGQLGPYWCGEDGHWVDVWLKKELPLAAKVGVLRHDFKEPLWGVAKFEGYKQTNKNGELTSFWKKMPDLMIAKCAESLALRKAFPNELSGLYSQEEMPEVKETEEIEQQEPIKLPDPPPQENAAQVAFKELQNYVPKYDPTEGALADPGEYRFDFGTFKGRMMKDIDTKEIHTAYLKAMEWVHRGNEPTSIYRVQFANMRKYLMMMAIEV